ncbi:hypothetical protein HID58_039964 [Brassica napus]|uniref:Cytochrome P450 n=1 Tax=Brassica napus TaxID=3708 RepID=A0ABQ8B6P0_BRANA|nr:hypothetical protein HID58_039964 [Brassica napus]
MGTSSQHYLMASLSLLEASVALLCFLICHHLLSKKPHDRFLKNWPVLGMLPGFLIVLHRIYDFSVEVLEQTNLTFPFKGPWFTGMDILVTVDPANIHYILSSNFSNYTKGADFKEVFDVFGEMIFNSDGDLWRNQRRAAQYMLNHQGFQKLSMSATRTKLDDGLVPLFDRFSKEEMVVDLQNLFQRFTFDTTFVLVTAKRHEVLSQGIHDQQQSNGECHEDLLTSHMKLDTTKYELLNPSDDKFLRDTILAFNLAGRDTTASALSWFFWLLSENPRVVTKIRQEIITNISLHGQDNLDKLVYLQAALYESMRLYPPVPFQRKSPIKPDLLPSGHKVEANSTIMIFLYALGRMRAVWGEDAMEFKPERWVSQSGCLRHEPSFKFLSFNAGPRTCPGKQLALTLIKTVAVEILQNYDIKVIKGQKIEPDPGLILYMKHGLSKHHNRLLRNWPVLGMLPGLLVELHRIYDFTVELLESTDLTFLLKGPWFSGMDMLLTVDPANIHYMLSSNFYNYTKGAEFKEVFDAFGDSILTTESEAWKNLRKASQVMINHHGFQKLSVSTTMSKLKEGLVPLLNRFAEEGATVDLQDVFGRFMFDTTLVIVTGCDDPRSLSFEMPEDESAKALHDIGEGILYRHALVEATKLVWSRKREEDMIDANATFDRVCEKHISAKREEIARSEGHPTGESEDLLTSHMKLDAAKYKLSSSIDDKFLRDTILTFILAGRDTIASVLTWFFWLLSENPNVLSKIRREMDTNLQPSSSSEYDPTEQFNKLVYLHATLCETMRLYPPVPIERGEDASEFKPERWISETGVLRHEPSFKFLAFNAGPRTCLGKKMAMVLMKAVVVEILQNFDVKVAESLEDRTRSSFNS